MKIAIVGAGAWGTALAIALARKHDVALWGRDQTQMTGIAALRENTRYLPGIKLAENIRVMSSFAAAADLAEVVLVATSTSGLTETVNNIKNAGIRPTPVIWACKGFDRNTGLLPHETVSRAFSSERVIGVLSGPSFADEVAAGLPCALTLATNDFDAAKVLASEFSGGTLRVYSSPDLVGVELGGALKNVMAIAAGISDGMRLGLNARAALITRGLAEMVRLGVAMGGKAETFMGLTGVGDLILTATGNLSRNRKVGMLLAEGKSLDDILAHLGHVAEGVNSAQTALALAKKHNISMPITEAVNAVLFANANPHDAVKSLLARETKAE